jgi:LysR family transcriptional regulator, glycine cleavage system transcriptional activator
MSKPDLPPLSWLRAYEAAARHLSFTSAAQELNLSQAAISKHVRSLELHLREQLFHRKPRSLILTKAGAAYLPKVRDAFERLVAGTREVFGDRRNEILTVRVNVSFSVCWLAPRLPDFFRFHPDVDLRIVSSVWNEDLDLERFDLDIRYGKGQWPGLRSDPLTVEALEPLCSPALLAGGNPIREPADLLQHKLIHVLGYEEGWAAWLNAAGLGQAVADGGFQVDTTLMAFEMAACGLGVALGRRSLNDRDLQSGRLVRPFGLSHPVSEAFHLISDSSGAEHPDAAVFRAWLLDRAGTEKSGEAGVIEAYSSSIVPGGFEVQS